VRAYVQVQNMSKFQHQATGPGCPMAVMFDRYFGIPQSVMRDGIWARMKPSEQSLYVALCHESERYTSREMIRTDDELEKISGVSPRRQRDARIGLKERGLISFEHIPGRGHRYVLCNPQTAQPWPGDPKVRARYIRKAEGCAPAPAPLGADPRGAAAHAAVLPESQGVELKW
jgi:hypothetical protein